MQTGTGIIIFDYIERKVFNLSSDFIDKNTVEKFYWILLLKLDYLIPELLLTCITDKVWCVWNLSIGWLNIIHLYIM